MRAHTCQLPLTAPRRLVHAHTIVVHASCQLPLTAVLPHRRSERPPGTRISAPKPQSSLALALLVNAALRSRRSTAQ
jgi:hypothetical protein